MNAGGQTQNQPMNLEEWTELLRAQEMPIFSNTAQNIYASLDDRSKGAMELASVILQDPNLTAKLLKVGNSPYYNPSKQKMSTVSRAIVILGVGVIRELTLACSFFESILSSANKERANQEIAQAIHSAVQARELAIALRDQSPEEVFIAALLHNIGHIAFWCSGNKQTIQIHELILKSGLPAQQAEKKVLGFSLRDLGKKLSKSWHLGGLIEEAICQPDSLDKRVQTVQLGNQICEALSAGWDSEAMTACLSKMQRLSGESLDTITAKIKRNTDKAVDIARQFGAHDASKYISPERPQAPLEEHEEEHLDKKQIQFQVLQEITSLISGDIDLNVLFEMVLEGIHRGVEMDRTLFMLLSADKKSLKEKISLGWLKSPNTGKIHVFNSEAGGNLFFHVLHERDGAWLKPPQFPELYTPQIEQKVGRHECFVFPIEVENKPIGLIYCDRGITNRSLTIDDFSVSKHFAKQAHIGLTLYRMKNH